MNSSHDETVTCPHCGEEIPRLARVCPSCGSDDETGWSEQTYLDGLELPGEGDGYEEIHRREFGGGEKKTLGSALMIAVSLILVALFLFGLIRSLV